jgi:hypothetical protein
MKRLIEIGLALLATAAIGGCGGTGMFYMGQQPSVGYGHRVEHMPESVRVKVTSLAVVASEERPQLVVGGDYGREVSSTGEGAAEGVAAGVGVTGEMISEDPRALVLVPFVLPVAIVAGAVGGAAAAKIEQEVQKFREGLADDLAAAEDRPGPGVGLANELTRELARLDDVRVVPAGAPAEFTLTVAVTGIAVDTEEEDAIVTTDVMAELRSNPDGDLLHIDNFTYRDRASLRRWTKDDNARWGFYAEQARNHVAAEIAAQFFELIELRHVLRPRETATFGGGWNSQLKTATPDLSWEYFLLGGDDYDGRLQASDATFDLRIYDDRYLVYEARDIAGTEHRVAAPLENCKRLSWSVRPVHRFEGRTRAGEWMQYRSNFDSLWGNDDATESLQDFAQVSTRCRK